MEAQRFVGWIDAFPFLMARRGKRLGVPTGQLEVLVLESGGSSWPDESDLSVKSPCQELRMGQ